MQQFLGQLFVLGDRFRDGAGHVGLGGLDAALLAPPAELHQAALGQAAEGNIACHGGIDDRSGARAEADILVEFTQAVQSVGDVEGRVIDGCLAERLREFECQASDFLFAVFDHDLVGARFDGLRRAAERDGATGLCLQAERGELQDVCHGIGLTIQRRLQQGDFREALAQAGLETGNAVDVALGLAAGYDGFDGRVPAPQVGAAQRADA